MEALIKDLNAQKNAIKKNGITVDGRHFKVKFTGDLVYSVLFFIPGHLIHISKFKFHRHSIILCFWPCKSSFLKSSLVLHNWKGFNICMRVWIAGSTLFVPFISRVKVLSNFCFKVKLL